MANSNEFSVRFEGDASSLIAEINRLQKSLAQLNTNTVSQTRNVANNTRNMASSMTSSLTSLRNLIGGLGIGLGLGTITSGIKSMVSASAEMENIKTTFRVFTGSVKIANQTLSDLKKSALESPLNFQDFVQGAKTLMGYGVSASQVTNVVKMLGDVSGGSADRFQRLSLAFGQVVGAGRLMGQEARQMINAGFNPLQFIAEKTGKSMAQLQDEMRKGQISVQDVADAFKTATSEGGRFYGLSQEITNTLGGQWNKLQESLFFTLAEIGDKISETFDLKGIVSELSDYMLKLKNAVIEMIDAFKGNKYTVMYMKEFYTALGNIILALPKLIGLLTKLAEIITMLNPAFWMILATMKAFNLSVDKFGGKKLDVKLIDDKQVGSLLYANDELAKINKQILDIDKNIKLQQDLGKKYGMGDFYTQDLINQKNQLIKLRDEIQKGFEKPKKPSDSPSPEELEKIKQAQLKEYRSWEEAYANIQKLKQDALNKGVEFTQYTNDRLEKESMGYQGQQVLELRDHFEQIRQLYIENGLNILPLYKSYEEQLDKIQIDNANKRLQGFKKHWDDMLDVVKDSIKKGSNIIDLGTKGGIKSFLSGLEDPDPLGTFLRGAFQNASNFANSVPTLIGEGLGEILSGTVNFDESMRRIGNSVLGALGDFIKGLGQQLIKFGIASSGIQAALASILTPGGAAAAIGIGTLLVGIGSAMKNASQKSGQTVGGNARPSRVSATPVGRGSYGGSNSGMTTGSNYTYGGGTFATQVIKLSIDLSGSITASPTGYNINKQYETIARVTGR